MLYAKVDPILLNQTNSGFTRNAINVRVSIQLSQSDLNTS